MAIKHKTKKDELSKIIKKVQGIGERSIEVGALQGDHAWLAAIHEYGCKIEVTPKMRAFLHSQGLHLKASTEFIVIPERSFIRAGHDENIDRVMKQTERAISLVISGKMTVDDMLDLCGEQLATAIKQYAVKLRTPPNHPFTIEQKGSSNPLVDTGRMIESITWRKVRGG